MPAIVDLVLVTGIRRTAGGIRRGCAQEFSAGQRGVGLQKNPALRGDKKPSPAVSG
jgi:hypothetical protein